MAFTAKDVQKLREMTGVGMMDCKKALTDTDGDMDAAVTLLREKGLAAAAKKAGRIASEGIVYANVYENGVGVICEVNSETDFVAKNSEFMKFTQDVADVIASRNPADLDSLMDMPYPNSELTVADLQRDKVLVIGENIRIRRFARFDTGSNVSYVHMGGKIGVLVSLKAEGISNKPAIEELGKDVAMQIAAMNPRFLNRSEVDSKTLEEERSILMAQTMQEGKPPEVAEKIVAGRMNKFYQENCLEDQAYVKENKQSVKQHCDAVAKELGGSIGILGFVRFEKGEGLEKRSDNLADEVAKMVSGK
ncbi:MAG: translation elongation factor Ts [Oscillospiraceae bacterium]|jgi:elongation factor Ts|nr:translation elongation factor Ts [Oscillospiraceae bacterium]